MADGTVVIDTKLDNSGLEKGWKEANTSAKAQAVKLAAEYKKQGMSASEAFKKAWSEIERDSKEKSNLVSSNWGNCTNKLKGLASKATSIVATSIAGVGAALTGLGAIAIKEGIEFESAFTGVRKTVDATEEQFAQLENAIRNMAKNMPESAAEIAGVAEAAGQLGIQTENIEGFTETMVMLGDATNLSSEEAATQLARLANITGMSQEGFSKLGSSIVACGNNFATTESEITAMALRLAGAGKQVGLSESEIVGLSSALSSVGIEAEAGGTAFSTLMTKIQLAVETGNESLKDFSKVSGMSSSEFQKTFKEDSAKAILSFIDGLSKCKESGSSTIKVLDEMGITEIRMRDALLRASGASETFANAIKLSNNAWDENVALANEANTRYATMESQLKMLKNAAIDLGIEFYQSVNNPVADVVKSANDKIEELSKAFKNGGFNGLVKELGNIFSEIAVEIANNAPKIIKSATEVIKSFLKGIKNNSKLITKSAAEIMKCLVEAILELVPEMVSIGAEVISGLAEGLSNAIPGLGIILQPISDICKLVGENSKLALEGIIAFSAVSKISSIITNLSTAFSGLSVSMLALPSAPVIAALAVAGLGVAAYAEEQEALNNTFNVSEEEMGFVQKTLLKLNGIQTKSRKELEDLGAVYKEFGENIGSDFKSSVENATASIHEFNVALEEINLDETLTDSETTDFTKRVDDCVNSALDTIKNKKSESQSSMKDLFTIDDGIIDESEQAIIYLCTNEFDVEAEEVKKNQDAINQIYNTARTEGRSLNDDEIASIKNYYAQIKQIELEAQAENNSELEYSKIDFQNRVKNLDAQGASDLLVQKKEQLNELTIQKENEYDHVILAAQRGADKLTGADKEAAEKHIQTLKDEKEQTVQTYQDEWDKYKEIVEKEAPSIIGEYSNYTGKMLSDKDKAAQQGISYMQQHFENLGSITEEGWYRIYSDTDKSMHDVYATVDSTTGDITGCWDSTAKISSGATNDLKDKVKELGEEHETQKLTITQGLSEIAGSSVNSSGQMVNAIGNVVSELYNMQETSNGTYSAIVNLDNKPVKIETNSDGVITSMHQVGESFDDVAIKADSTSEEVKKKFQAAANDMPSVGGNIVSGIGTGIDNNKESLFSKIGGLCLGLVNRAKAALDIHSPSRVMRDQVGKWITLGIGEGIEKEVPALLSRITNVCDEITGTFETLLNANTAQGYIDTISNWGGSFAVLAEELQNAKDAVEISNAKTVDDNKWYSDAKYRLEDVKSKLEELSETISDTEDENTKKSLQSQQKALQKQQKIIQKEVDYYKEAAQEEIDVCKENAKKQLDIAKEKQSKLEQLIKGVTNALKEQLNQQKEATINAIEAEMDAEEKRYNKKVANIEKSTKRKVEAVQAEINALDQEKESESRLKEIQESKNNIAVLEAKMANTKSEADKKAYALKIKNAKAELSNKQSDWNREDAKKELQERIDDLNAKADTKKQHLKEDYEETKKHYEKQKKAAEDYYKTLLDTDNLNAQARYVLLTNSNEQLVQLLNSYAPNWQNAGQSLADSLINGLNSKKQDVANAVQELTSLRSKQVSGYATGTSYNRLAGTYTVDEKGFELSTNNNPVAYVSKGAAILNHMQSLKAIKDEVSGQVANQMSILRNMVQGQQQQMYELAGAMAGVVNNSSSIREGDINFNVDKYYNNTKSDIKETAEELGFYAQRKKRC
ncbi:phage tail tape measure protein [Clostridium sp. ZS2]|uniref:phage tail tape measure protein n=1 Tax=Clostridium sp. ZS2 TaxID=2949988 RepID=UPI00207AB0E1|nr:phage tail tape measure protein [Clostridium sp. ZS2]